MRLIHIDVNEVDGVITYFASTMLRSNTQKVVASGPNQGQAVANLKALVGKRADLEKAREGYPKTIEVDW